MRCGRGRLPLDTADYGHHDPTTERDSSEDKANREILEDSSGTEFPRNYAIPRGDYTFFSRILPEPTRIRISLAKYQATYSANVRGLRLRPTLFRMCAQGLHDLAYHLVPRTRTVRYGLVHQTDETRPGWVGKYGLFAYL